MVIVIGVDNARGVEFNEGGGAWPNYSFGWINFARFS